MSIKVKYFDSEMDKLQKIDKGDWIDLRVANASFVNITNTIIRENGIPVLRRTAYESPVVWETGLFEDENGKREEVKFFRYGGGQFLKIDLGIAMELPEGKEAHVLPRGSTFKNFQVIETNAMGIVDNTFKGDNDKWFMPVLAMHNGFMMYNERICQFRIVDSMGDPILETVEKLEGEDRGSHGSTGTK